MKDYEIFLMDYSIHDYVVYTVVAHSLAVVSCGLQLLTTRMSDGSGGVIHWNAPKFTAHIQKHAALYDW